MKVPEAINNSVRKAMQGNTYKDTSIERIFRRALWKRGVRFRKNVKSILGVPDVAIKKYRLAVFCDGDFWHGKELHEFKNHKEYWNQKIKLNKERDLEITIRLRDEGWTVLRFWGSEIKDDVDKCVDKIIETIELKKKAKRRRAKSK